ncbi:MAG: hypothetical protein D6719_13485 [Candidatus Dadabacteria bacterium]|nr:MAG: hypothetical protein D6719_13485 [Candidatus Dadabacteria bacterium]
MPAKTAYAFRGVKRLAATILIVLTFSACTKSPGGGDSEIPIGVFDREISQQTENFTEDSSCGQLLDLPARGLACLHCNIKIARAQANNIISLMERSCVRNLATNFLVDGTFSFDAAFMKQVIDRLSAVGRRATIIFYLMNGPNQRRWDITEINSFGGKIEPQEFRSRIQSDPALQERFRSIVRKLVPVLRHGNGRARMILIPALEDNLSDSAANAMYNLILDEVPSDIHFELGRNPCPNCYRGNQSGISPGVLHEKHTISFSSGVSNGIITNDGHGFKFESGDQSGNDPTITDLAMVMHEAQKRGNVFILWNKTWQGLKNYSLGAFPDPRTRGYPLPTPAEEAEIIQFLRL